MCNDKIEVDPAIVGLPYPSVSVYFGADFFQSEDSQDEDYGSIGYDTSTQSLSSSVNEYVFQNG
jgi:hypothetical protein